MKQYNDEQKMHHYMGRQMNNQTWRLLGKTDRSEDDDEKMVYFAKASLYHWRKSPQFEPVNEQRGQWMIAHVFAVLNRGEEALTHAETCMDITMNESLKDFDLAYAYECKARAYASLGQSEKMNKCFLNAKAAGETIKKDTDRKLFFSDLQREPWYEYPKTEN
jgi:hypothetical protein